MSGWFDDEEVDNNEEFDNNIESVNNASIDTDEGLYNVVNEQMQRSSITRIPWKLLLGISLTKYTHNLRKKGYSPKEIINIVKTEEKVITFLKTNNQHLVFKNLKITVCSIISAAKTAEKIYNEN